MCHYATCTNLLCFDLDGKNGRVYTVTLRVRDSSGNTTRATYKVSMPIDQSGAGAVDSGAKQTVTSSCQ